MRGWFFGYLRGKGNEGRLQRVHDETWKLLCKVVAGGSKDEHRKHNIETRIKHRLQMEYYEYRLVQYEQRAIR